jgi:hypothetical protein
VRYLGKIQTDLLKMRQDKLKQARRELSVQRGEREEADRLRWFLPPFFALLRSVFCRRMLVGPASWGGFGATAEPTRLPEAC